MIFMTDISMPPLIQKMAEGNNRVFILKEKESLEEFFMEKTAEAVTTIYFKSLKTKEDFECVMSYFKTKGISQIDHFFPFNETKYNLYYDFINEMGIQSHVTESYCENTNKIVAREKINNVFGDVKFYNLDECSVEDLKYPCILKPRTSNGSKNVSKIESAEELKEATVGIVKEDYYIEEFITGEEISVEAIHYNNKHHIFGVTKKIKYTDSVVEKGHIANGIELSEKDIKKIEEVFDVLDYDNTVSHSEFMLTEDGIVYIESHPRLGGDLIPSFYETSFKDDIYEVLIDVLKGNVKDEIQLRDQDRKYFSYCPAPNKFPQKLIIDKVKQEIIKSRFCVDILIVNSENETVIADQPLHSFDRPILLRGSIPIELDIQEHLENLDIYCNEHVFFDVAR